MTDRIGQQWGNYRLIQLLGRGGFAEVYLGQHIRLASQRAALKILSTQVREGDIETFQNEAETIVSLVHPHIVRILDFALNGETPYLVMDYAVGGSLRQRHPRGQIVDLAKVVSYVQQVADGLQYAHDRKIIHRDIKPDNMLIGVHNEILLSDFGIAAIAHATSSQVVMDAAGTVPYMAPEQIQEHPRPASDQYSLAITAFEWLTGKSPFSGTFTEVAIKHVMVPPPPLRNFTPSLPSEVEQVVLTALAKDPRARFQTVRAFANALTHASNYATVIEVQSTPLVSPIFPISPVSPAKPIQSAPPAQQSQSNPAIMQGAGPSSIPPSSQVYTQFDTGDKQREAGPSSVPPSSQVYTQFDTGDKQQGPLSTPPPQVYTQFDTGDKQRGSGPSFVPPSSQFTQLNTGDKQQGSGPPPITPLPPVYTQFDTGRDLEQQKEPMTLPSSVIGGMAPIPNASVTTAPPQENATKPRRVSRRVVLAGLLVVVGAVAVEGSVLVWNASHSQHPQPAPILKSKSTPTSTPASSRGLVYRTYNGHTAPVRSIAWSPKSTLIASGSEDKTIQIWDSSTGTKSIDYTRHTAHVLSVAWSPDGTRIASGAQDRTAQIWNASTGTPIVTYRRHTDDIHSVEWSHDGKRVASGSDDTTVQIWDASAGTPIIKYSGHSRPVESVEWSPDDTHIVSASDDHTVQIWDASNGTLTFKFPGHTDWVLSARWSPDGKYIASTGRDKTVQVWDASTGTVSFSYHGHTNWVEKVVWSSDGKYLASASDDHTVHIIDATTGNLIYKFQESSEVYGLAWSLDGKRIASGGNDKLVQIWNAS